MIGPMKPGMNPGSSTGTGTLPGNRTPGRPSAPGRSGIAVPAGGAKIGRSTPSHPLSHGRTKQVSRVRSFLHPSHVTDANPSCVWNVYTYERGIHLTRTCTGIGLVAARGGKRRTNATPTTDCILRKQLKSTPM